MHHRGGWPINRSRWPRDENDADREAKIGRNTNDPTFTGGSFGNKDKYVAIVHDSRMIGDNLNNPANNMGG